MTDAAPNPEGPAPEHVRLDIQDILRILPHRFPFLLNDPVDEQKRKPMGENPQNVLNIKPNVLGCGTFRIWCGVCHSGLVRREDYTLSHAPGGEMETCDDRARTDNEYPQARRATPLFS